jgi:hypothetical protein
MDASSKNVNARELPDRMCEVCTTPPFGLIPLTACVLLLVKLAGHHKVVKTLSRQRLAFFFRAAHHRTGGEHAPNCWSPQEAFSGGRSN